MKHVKTETKCWIHIPLLLDGRRPGRLPGQAWERINTENRVRDKISKEKENY